MENISTSEKIKNLYKEQEQLNKLLQNIYSDIKNNRKKINELMKNFPTCYSCGKHTDPKHMYIATPEDIKTYVDQNDGYNGPKIGEYYCGC